MRKGLTFVTALVLLFCFALPRAARAAEAPGNVDRDILAQYAGSLDGCYTCKVDGGGASVTTSGDVTVAVKGVFPDNLTLVVMPVLQSDTQAWSWFAGMMSGKAEKFMPFDIYFTDGSGSTVTVTSDIEVTVTVPDGYANPAIYNLFPNETLNKLGSAATGKNLAFTYSGVGYIVLTSVAQNSGSPGGKGPATTPTPNTPGNTAEPGDDGKLEDGGDGNPNGEGREDEEDQYEVSDENPPLADGDDNGSDSNPQMPRTGDDSNMTLWLMIGGASLAMIGGMILTGWKKKNNGFK